MPRQLKITVDYNVVRGQRHVRDLCAQHFRP